jgi:two-component system nitrate/nitrite response regulator NarL
MTLRGAILKLVLCDDNRLLAEALAAALRAWGYHPAAVTTSAAAGVSAVAEHRPDACLLDLRFPSGADGLTAARQMRAQSPRTAVVMLSGTLDPSVTMQARSIGVAGYLAKDQSVSQIASALQLIISGRSFYGPARPGRPPAQATRRPPSRYDLTPRETEVLRRIVAGQTTTQMSLEMNIAVSTLRTYVKNLLTKLGTHTRLQAAALASREGLLTARQPA